MWCVLGRGRGGGGEGDGYNKGILEVSAEKKNDIIMADAKVRDFKRP